MAYRRIIGSLTTSSLLRSCSIKPLFPASGLQIRRASQMAANNVVPGVTPDAPAPSSITKVNKDAHPFSRAQLEGLVAKRFFYTQAFEIYGGVSGLYDYGPTGAALQANIIAAWRQHFILEEEMLELETTIMTPHEVLKTSGHVDKFADWMCKDSKNGEIYRADHLVEGVMEARLLGDEQARKAEGAAGIPVEQSVPAEGGDSKDEKKARKKKVKATAAKLDDAVKQEYESILAQIDNYSGPELGKLIRKYEIRAPESGNEVSEPVEFNLMFDTQIGPTGQLKGYLRPETAQGHFVNFGRLLDFNNGRVPFASAHIGKSFRNEISPRAGLLRVREFTMAEIEHFVDPLEKNHERFHEVSSLTLSLLPKDTQQAGKTTITHTTIGEAVKSKMIDNETLGYFLGRIHLFMLKIGIDEKRLRFRQHMANEMAHYASDCWDAEILTSYGWIECVGCADRSAYDLTVHAKKTKKDLVVRKALKEPKIYDKLVAVIDKKLLGPKFKKEARQVEGLIEGLDQAGLESLQSQLKNGKATVGSYEVTPDLVRVELRNIKEMVYEFTPNVIEPSFGIGRIFYALLEHSFWSRAEDKDRGVLSLPALVAPIKALVVPISSNEKLTPLVKEVGRKLRDLGVPNRVDDSGATIGRRYSRNDELGTPFACTLDFASLSKGTVSSKIAN
jgi:glycyl-tRNA synthetase